MNKEKIALSVAKIYANMLNDHHKNMRHFNRGLASGLFFGLISLLTYFVVDCSQNPPNRENYPTTYVDVFYSRAALEPARAKDLDKDGCVDAIVSKSNHVIFYDSTVLGANKDYQGGHTFSSIPVGKNTIKLLQKTISLNNDLKYHLDSLTYEYRKQ